MRPPSHSRFVEKAAAALTSAVEVYNKPAFAYREETFAILALNAWELLLKAKIMLDAKYDIRSLRVYEPRQTKSGAPSKKVYVRRNRAGNPFTISFGTCLDRLDQSPSKLPPEVKANLSALLAIRDNSVHYLSASTGLALQAQQLASASIRNFVVLAKQWFKRDFADSMHLILPLSFLAQTKPADAVAVSADEGRLIKHLKELSAFKSGEDSAYAVAVRIELKLEKSSAPSVAKVQISKDADAIKVTLSEQDIREKYPWDYKELCKRLRKRYSDFKEDNRFHGIRKPLLSDERFAKPRFLDPGNPKSPKKDFYGSNVLNIFDAHYRKALSGA